MIPSACRPRPVLPAIWRELRLPLEVAALLLAPPAGAERPRPGGGPVLLIPGFLAGDATLRPLAARLSAAGYEPRAAGIACNRACSEASVARMLRRVEDDAARDGRRVALVGHSRGGLFARVIAQRRPDLVSAVVTLGSPHRDQLAVHPLVWAQAAGLAALNALGVDGVVGTGCAAGTCCAGFAEDLAAPVPDGVPYLSIFSPTDGVVDWRACLDPDGRHRAVRSSHCGLAVHPEAVATVLSALDAATGCISETADALMAA